MQGLRAVAVLLVIGYHAGLGVPGGFVGVDVFFVISGYVITGMLMRELIDSDRVDLRRFYLRRIRRLIPALALVLVFVLIAGVLLAPIGGQQLASHTGVAAMFFSGNFYLLGYGGDGYFDLAANYNALLHLWSLAVEEQFYLLYPAALIGAWTIGRRLRRCGGRRAATALLIAVAVASFTLSLAFETGHANSFWPVDDPASVTFYSSPTRAWEFALGGLLALGGRRLLAMAGAVAQIVVLAGAAMLAVAAVAFDSHTSFVGGVVWLPVLGTLCMIGGGENRSITITGRVLSCRPAQFIGEISYSWYLWHWPLIVFATALWPSTALGARLAAAASLLPAWLSYRFVERPIRLAPSPRTRRTVTMAVAMSMVVLACAAGLDVAHAEIRKSDAGALLYRSQQPAEVSRPGCFGSAPLGDPSRARCTWTVDDAEGRAVLVGDSNAQHFTQAFITSANDNHLDATVGAYPGCPFVDLTLVRSGSHDVGCRAFVVASLRDLIASPPTVVVLAGASDLDMADPTIDFDVPGRGRVSGAAAKAAAWRDGLTRTVDALHAAGIRTTIVDPVPRFPKWDVRGCAVIRVLLDQASCATHTTRSYIDVHRKQALTVERDVAAATGSDLLDVADVLCPGTICSTFQHGKWFWRDAYHLSVDGSVALTDAFSAMFAAVHQKS